MPTLPAAWIAALLRLGANRTTIDVMPSLRTLAGALVRDVPRFAMTLRGLGRYRRAATPWIFMHNRNERITSDGRGVRCEWEFTSDLHLANVLPSTSSRLMRAALGDWPIVLRDAPVSLPDAPTVSFIIGHRGLARLPHLQATLRSIAAQEGVPFECIVVEQSVEREIESTLPPWVRYVHTPVEPTFDYCRSWTLNVGARMARGELLILHDNDMLAPASYAAEALARFREGWSFVDLKRFIFYLDDTDTDTLLATRQFPGKPRTVVVQNAHGGTFASSRPAFFEVGGFDESFVGWGGEDNEFWDRAETTGRAYTFGYLPFVHLWHSPQKGKSSSDSPALARYHQLRAIPPAERILTLRRTRRGSRTREP